jgi:hypothetical protein
MIHTDANESSRDPRWNTRATHGHACTLSRTSVPIGSLIKRWRARRQQKIAEQYANLSDEERNQLDELREQHNPLTESSGSSQAEWWYDSWRR